MLSLDLIEWVFRKGFKEEKILKNKMNIVRFFAFSVLMLTLSAAMAGDPAKGRGIYASRCSGCHGTNGVPLMPTVPNFTMGQGVMKSDREVMIFIKKGKAVMPAFEGILTDEEILDVIAHIRTLF
jgi:cytochrome c6